MEFINSSLIKESFWSLPYSFRRTLYSLRYPGRAKNLELQRIGRLSGITFVDTLKAKCIFVHIPKVAGTSVRQAVFGSLSGAGHTDVRSYQLGLGENEWRSFYKFAFVRNPWDRCYSAYRYLKFGKLNHNNKAWASENLSEFSEFSDFVGRFLDEKTMLLNHVLRPQFRYICTVGSKVSVDFVGRFENLHEDFHHVLKILGKPSIDLPLLNASGPPADYREHYSAEAAEKVSRLYATDIKLFGYQF